MSYVSVSLCHRITILLFGILTYDKHVKNIWKTYEKHVFLICYLYVIHIKMGAYVFHMIVICQADAPYQLAMTHHS